MKRLFVSEAAQQPLVNWTMLLVDIGLAIVLVMLALFVIWSIYDLVKRDGRWSREVELDLEQPAAVEPVMVQEVQS